MSRGPQAFAGRLIRVEVESWDGRTLLEIPAGVLDAKTAVALLLGAARGSTG